MVLKQQVDSIIYLRTSTDLQNPENQLASIQQIAPGNAAVLTETESAFKETNRPQFDILKKKIYHRQIKHVYVWDLDRLHRNRKRLVAFFKLCKLHGVKVHSYRQQWLESLNQAPEPFDEIMHDLMLNLMGWLAEDESKKKSERVKASLRHKEGVTYSHKGNRWGRKPVSHNVTNQVLQLHKQGLSIRRIAAQVNHYDKNRNLRPLSKSAVHKIISEFHARGDS